MTHPTIIFVTQPGTKPPTGGFTGAHARALEEQGAHAIVILEEPAATAALAPAVTVPLPRASADIDHACSSTLLGMLTGLEESERIVIADGDAAWIEQLAPKTREVGARLLGTVSPSPLSLPAGTPAA